MENEYKLGSTPVLAQGRLVLEKRAARYRAVAIQTWVADIDVCLETMLLLFRAVGVEYIWLRTS